jgi:hypothetical protein
VLGGPGIPGAPIRSPQIAEQRRGLGSAGESGDALTVRIARVGSELAAAIDRRQPLAETDPYASATPMEQLLRNR